MEPILLDPLGDMDQLKRPCSTPSPVISSSSRRSAFPNLPASSHPISPPSRRTTTTTTTLTVSGNVFDVFDAAPEASTPAIAPAALCATRPTPSAHPALAFPDQVTAAFPYDLQGIIQGKPLQKVCFGNEKVTKCHGFLKKGDTL